MSRFVLTAEIKLRGPSTSEMNAISSQMKAGLSGINVPINFDIPASQQRVLKNVAADLRTVKKHAQETTDSFELMGKSLSQNIRRYGSFTIATGAFIRLGIAIRQSVGEAIDFETEIRKIAQGQDKAISSFGGLKKEIDNLSKSLGVSSLGLANTSRILAQAGLSTNEVKSALEALAKSELAPTFGDINETTEASIAIFRQFKIEADELKSVLGSINKVSADFAVESEDIGVAIRLSGAAFAAASPQFQKGEESLRQFISLFTSIRQTTRGSAESIATGLRTITTRLQRGGTIEYFRTLGVELRDSQGQFIGAYNAIREISKALKDIPGTDPRFANIAELLGGYRGIDKTIPLLQQFAVAEKAYQSALEGRESIDKGVALAQETLSQSFKRVGQEFDSMIRKISEDENMRRLIKLALDLSSAMIKVVDSITPLLPLIAGIGLIKIGFAAPKIGRGFVNDYKHVVGRKTGGPVHFATGGNVPGTGSGDKIPAMLEPGEYVIPKDAVGKHSGAFWQALREGKTPQKFATGGGVGKGRPYLFQTDKTYNNGTEETIESKEHLVYAKTQEEANKLVKEFAKLNSVIAHAPEQLNLLDRASLKLGQTFPKINSFLEKTINGIDRGLPEIINPNSTFPTQTQSTVQTEAKVNKQSTKSFANDDIFTRPSTEFGAGTAQEQARYREQLKEAKRQKEMFSGKTPDTFGFAKGTKRESPYLNPSRGPSSDYAFAGLGGSTVEEQQRKRNEARAAKSGSPNPPNSNNPNNPNQPKGSGTNLALWSVGIGFAVDAAAKLGRSHGYLSEASEKTITQLGGFVAALGVGVGALQQFNSLLPQVLQDKISGIAGGLTKGATSKFAGLSRASKITGGVAGVATLAAGLYATHQANKGLEEVNKNKTGVAGAGRAVGGGTASGAISGAALGATIGTFIPIPILGTAIGAAVGGAIGAAIGSSSYASEVQKNIDNRDKKGLTKSIANINSGGKVKQQDIANTVNALSTFEDTQGGAFRASVRVRGSLFGGNGKEEARSRTLSKQELEDKGIEAKTIESLYQGIDSQEGLNTLSKSLNKVNEDGLSTAKVLGINTKQMEFEQKARLKTIQQMKELEKVFDASAGSVARYQLFLDKLNTKFDIIEAKSGLASSVSSQAESGVRQTADFSAFEALAKKGVRTTEVDNILNSGPNKNVSERANLEVKSAEIQQRLLNEKASLGTLDPKSLLDKQLSGDLEKELRNLFAGAGPEMQQMIQKQGADFESLLIDEFGNSPENQIRGSKVTSFSDKVKNTDKPSLEAEFRLAKVINKVIDSMSNLSKKILTLSLDRVAKLSSNMAQFDDTLNTVTELKGGTFNKVSAAESNRAIQLGVIGNITGQPIGASGNPVTDVARLGQLKSTAEAGLAPLNAKLNAGEKLSQIEADKLLAFEAQLQGATAGLKVFGEDATNIAEKIAKASELKQRREAAGSSALGYLTSDAAGKRQQRKDLSFATRLANGQVNLKDFQGNAGGVQAAKQLFGEKDTNQFLAKIPGLEGLFKPNKEEDKLHQQILLENQARKNSNDLLTKQVPLMTALNKELALAKQHFQELMTPQGQANAQQNQGPNQAVIHQGNFQYTINLNVTGINENLVNREQVKEMLQVSINNWWNQQFGKQNKVNVGPEHVGEQKKG